MIEDIGIWQHGKLYQSSSVTHENLRHHDDQQTPHHQQLRQRNRIAHAVWKTALVTDENSNSEWNSRKQQPTTSDGIIHRSGTEYTCICV